MLIRVATGCFVFCLPIFLMTDSITTATLNTIDFKFVFESMQGISVLLQTSNASFTILAVTDGMLKVQPPGTTRQQLVGKPFFNLFLPNPDDIDLEKETIMRNSFDYVTRYKKVHTITAQRYDMANRDGTYSERYWNVRNTPFLNDAGEVMFIIHSSEDVTDTIKSQVHEEQAQGLKQAYKLFMMAPAAICVLKGDDLVVELANDLYLEIAGRTRENFVGRPVWDSLPEVKDQGFDVLLRNVMASGKSFQSKEHSITLQRGKTLQTIYVDFIYEPIKDENGVVNRIMIVVSEVTDRVISRKRSEQSENKIRSIIEAAPVAIALFTGRELIIDMANHTFMEILGRGGDIVGKPLAKAMPELEGQPFLQILDDVYTSGKTFETLGTQVNIMYNGVLKNGFYDFSYTPLFDEEGKVYAILEISVDVTSQVLARKKIIEGEQRLRSLVESAPFPIGVYVGKEMTIELANQAIINIWGKGDDVIGKRYRDVVPELSRQEIFEQIESVFNSGIAFNAKNQPIELETDGKSATYYFSYSFTPLFDLNGAVYGVMSTAVDVTQLNVALQKIEKSEGNLRNIIVQSPVAMCILRGPEYMVEIVNERMTCLWGKPEEEVINMPIFESLPEAKGQGLESLLDNVLLTGQTFKANERPVALLREGKIQTIYVNFVYEPLYEFDGTISGIMAVAIEVTDQVMARKQVEESETYLQKLTDTAPAMIWITEPDGYCTYLNKHWYDYSGQTKKEAEGFGWLSATHPEDTQVAEKAFKESNAGKVPFTVQYRLRHKSGQYRWVIDTGSPRFNPDGIYEGMIGTVIDVHEQKEAEQTICYKNALLEALNEASQDGIVLVSKNSEIISYNQRFIDIWQMPQPIIDSKDDAAALSFAMTQLIDPTRFIEKVDYLYSDRTESSIDELEFKDGKIVQRHGYPVIGEDGTYYAWSWTFRDITSQKIYEKTITENEERFRTLAETLPQLVWMTDGNGEQLYASSRWKEFSGLEPDGLHSWQQVVHADDMEKIMSEWASSKATGKIYKTEVRLKNKAGNYRWHFVQGEPIQNGQGEITRWIGAFTDIHNQKLSEQQLEALVAQRTLDLERSNEDLQQFAHVASHDLKEPVRKIKLFAGRLHDELQQHLTSAGNLYLSKIESAANRMITMIDGVLTYSSLNDSIQLIEKVDLNEIIAHVETDLEVAIHQRNAIITHQNLPIIQGIPVLIHQLFYNLVNNSLKFAKNNEPLVITITSKNYEEQGKALIQVQIKDNGIGFYQEYAERIFETFARLNSKDKYEGTGLGLALCKKIVHRHYGTIVATGLGEEGALFTITLPQIQADKLI